MPWSEQVEDNFSSGASYEYTNPISVKNFKQVLIYIKEEDESAVKVKVEGRASHDSRSAWKDILAETGLAQNNDMLICADNLTGFTQAETLDEAWQEIRVGAKNSGGTGSVYVVVNRRRR